MDLATAYKMRKKGAMASEHRCEGPDCEMCGGDKDLVSRVMSKRMSKGGQVANQEHGYKDSKLADFDENEFDDLVLRDDLESEYDAENSGDELGMDDDEDMVSRVMRSRKKK